MIYDLKELLRLANWPADRPTLRAIAAGIILPLMGERSASRQQPLSWSVGRISSAVDRETFSVYFDAFGRFCGYLVWTRVPTPMQDELMRSGPDVFDSSLFGSEGDAWVLAFHSVYGELPAVLRDLRDRVFCNDEHVTYFRQKHGRRMVKRASRSSHATFFRHTCATERDSVDMLARHKKFLETASNNLRAALDLGRCLILLSSAEQYSKFPLLIMLRRIMTPISQMQYRLYFSPEGELDGLLTWAWLSRETLERPRLPLHAIDPSMLNEGANLCICDSYARSGTAAASALAADLAGSWFPDEHVWRYPEIRQHNDSGICSLVREALRNDVKNPASPIFENEREVNG